MKLTGEQIFCISELALGAAVGVIAARQFARTKKAVRFAIEENPIEVNVEDLDDDELEDRF